MLLCLQNQTETVVPIEAIENRCLAYLRNSNPRQPEETLDQSGNSDLALRFHCTLPESLTERRSGLPETNAAIDNPFANNGVPKVCSKPSRHNSFLDTDVSRRKFSSGWQSGGFKSHASCWLIDLPQPPPLLVTSSDHLLRWQLLSLAFDCWQGTKSNGLEIGEPSDHGPRPGNPPHNSDKQFGADVEEAPSALSTQSHREMPRR
jgi:hypothetical protein